MGMARIGGRSKLPAAYHLFIALWWDRPSQTTVALATDMDANSVPSDRCNLEHRLFSSFGELLFRRAETDGTPVMVVKLGREGGGYPVALPAAGVRHPRRDR